MKMKSLRAVVSLQSVVCFCLVLSVNSQCFSTDGDDDSKSPTSTDLSHVTTFSLQLFKELLPNDTEANIFFAPYSVWNALALAYIGAEGNTKLELQTVLRIQDKVSTLKTWKALDYIYKLRQITSSGFSFGLVNRVYFDSSLTLRSCVKDVLTSELQLVDFSEPETSSRGINDFVKEVTEGDIGSIVSPSDLEGVRVALVNAAFYRDLWKQPFKKVATRKEPFYSFRSNGTVELMTQTAVFNHGISETLRVHVLELPYSLSDISMYILLPPSLEGEKGFNHLVENLNQESLKAALDGLWLEEIDVAIPKIVIEESIGQNLKEALQRLGIFDLFSAEGANLTSFVPEGGVSVSKMFHKASLVVSEEGIEASDGTVVQETARSARPSYLKTFVCDHPFVFTIYDKLTNNILFMGAFKNPIAQ